jgi:hypothetical protein
MRGQPRKATPVASTRAGRAVVGATPSKPEGETHLGATPPVEDPAMTIVAVSGPAARGRNTRKSIRVCARADSSAGPSGGPVEQGPPARAKKRRLGAVSNLWDGDQNSPMTSATVPSNLIAPVPKVGGILGAGTRRNLRGLPQRTTVAASSHNTVPTRRDSSTALFGGCPEDEHLPSPPGDFDFLVSTDRGNISTNKGHGPDVRRPGAAEEHAEHGPDGDHDVDLPEGDADASGEARKSARQETPKTAGPRDVAGVPREEQGGPDAGEAGGADTEGESDPEEENTSGRGRAVGARRAPSAGRSSERRLSAPQTGGKRRPQRALVLLSGMHTEEQLEIMRTLSTYSIVCKPGKHKGWVHNLFELVW